jgi:hypothetical protein
MRNHVSLWMIALVVSCAMTANAADISGKWVAQVPGRQGQPQEQTFMFKMEGGKLTGTVSSARGEEAITEGTVSGEDVSFVVVRQGGQGQVKELYKGKIAGSEIKFTRTREGGAGGGGRGGPVEFVAKLVSFGRAI